jgi:hypothetical protein
MIGILFAVALSLFGRAGMTDCVPSAIYAYEDGSYTLESEPDVLTCNLESHPGESIAFDTVSYDDYHNEIIVTHTSYTFGDDLQGSTTLIKVIAR